MIPDKTDPRWIGFLNNMEKTPVGGLATKMLMARLKLMDWQKSEPTKQKAIGDAHEFFSKNEGVAVIRNDIKLIFG
jgi:hypothetical protein